MEILIQMLHTTTAVAVAAAATLKVEVTTTVQATQIIRTVGNTIGISKVITNKAPTDTEINGEAMDRPIKWMSRYKFFSVFLLI